MYVFRDLSMPFKKSFLTGRRFVNLIVTCKSLTFYIQKGKKMFSLPDQASPEELLSFVRPLYPNGIFPLGPGWRIILCVLIGFVLAKILLYYTPSAKRRREAFAVLNTLRRRFSDDKDISMLACGLSVLMRRAALARFGREKTAGLNAEKWIDFLERTGADLNEQDRYLLKNQAYAPPSLCQALGIFIPLIVVNCIVLGRAEAFAAKNGFFRSMLDGAGMGLGFALTLTMLGAIREFLSSGSVFEIKIITAWTTDFLLPAAAPGAFIIVGCILAFKNFCNRRKAIREGRLYVPPKGLDCRSCRICK